MTAHTASTDQGADLPVLAADAVILGDYGGDRYILLVQRRNEPYALQWAIPGGRVNPGESLESAARRELAEETGLLVPDLMVEVGIYTDRDRDPRGRVISAVYLGLVDGLPRVSAGDDATEVTWWKLRHVLDGRVGLAFDHQQIVTDAMEFVDSATWRPEGGW